MVNIQTVSPRALLRGFTPRVQGIGSGDLGAIKLRGREFKATVTRNVLDAPITRTMDGASSLSIVCADPGQRLMESKLLEAGFDVELDGLGFSYVGPAFDTEAETTTLKFEDREVHVMRPAPGKADKADRADITRAEFCAVRFARHRVPVWCPALHDVQAIKTAAASREDSLARDERRGPGLDEGAKLTVKGVAANSSQLALGDRMLRDAASVGATAEVMVGLICATINETLIANMTTGDRSSTGPLQVLAETAASLGIDPRNIEEIVDAFVNRGFTGAGSAKELSKRMAIEQWLGLVMFDGTGAQRYPGLQYIPEAQEWVQAFNGGSAEGSVTKTTNKPYKFEQPPNEGDWDCVKRLMEDVRWRVWVSNGLGYMIAEPDLFNSRARMVLYPGAPGIDKISGNNDSGRRVNELTFSGRARFMAAPPGTVVIVKHLGEMVNGRYLVKQVTGNALSKDFSATINRPVKPLPEPAPETSTKTVDLGARGSTGNAAGLRDINLTLTAGAPHWGGSADVMHQLVDEIASDHGLTPGGTKETGHTAGGDHDPAETLAYATDYGTSDGEAFAREVARVLGDESVVHTYEFIYFEVDGHKFRAQVLWRLSNPSPGPGDYAHRGHVHVGIRRIG